MVEPNIFNYQSYRTWLRAWFDHRAGRTVRGFARAVGCSPALVSRVRSADPKQHLPLQPAMVEAFLGRLELDAEQAEFFRKLVRWEDHAEGALEERLGQEIATIRAYHHARLLEQEHYRLHAAWYHPALFELTRCVGFQDNVRWLARTLRPRITQALAGRAIDALIAAGLLRYELDGRLAPTHQVVASTPDAQISPEEKREALLELYDARLKLASKALHELGPHERHFTGSTMAIPEARLPELRQRLMDMQRSILSELASDPTPPDRVYQLNIELFPLSERTHP